MTGRPNSWSSWEVLTTTSKGLLLLFGSRSHTRGEHIGHNHTSLKALSLCWRQGVCVCFSVLVSLMWLLSGTL